ncbi:hypothetical protein HDU76_000991 [Blyttiomyces sp. JEL0837]|nr:hypothetical protein HDU76_000991 [Blyttiomyces sp. JEL0837]
MVLGDYGAEIIKVESLTGDDTRSWGPPFAHAKTATASAESSYFLGINRNKKSITLNFKKPEGVEIIRKLAAKSDVLIENFIPGKLDSMGLGYEHLRKVNPKLIYASITGYGPDGPASKQAGYDVIIEAEAGLMHITGEADGPPVKVGVAITDITTGLFTHGAVMGALLARERTKQGQKIDVSLLECQVSALANVAHAYLIGGQEARRWGTRHASIVPYQAFPTADSHIVLGAGNDVQFKKLCDVIGRADLPNDSRFVHNNDRVQNRESLVQILSSVLQTQATSHWLEMLRPTGIPCGPVNNISQTFEHPQVIHRKMIEEVEHPTVGKVKMVGIPVKFSDTKPSVRMPPPILGQHTEEILSEFLGYDSKQISHLVDTGVVSRSHI